MSLFNNTSNKFSDANLAALASHVGFRGQDLVTAVAVAIAESGGEANDYNDTTSSGLWQVQYSSHKDLVKSQNALFNPLTNVEAAYAVYRGSGWDAWDTYKKGTYKQYLPRAEAAVANQSPPSFKQLTGSKGSTSLSGDLGAAWNEANDWGLKIPLDGGTPSLTTQGPGGMTAGVYTGSGPTKTGNNTITNPLDALGALTAKSTWIRVAEIAAGVALLLMGLYLAAKGFGNEHS